jgi:nucleotide-binding universal stress UspA family protein
LTVDSTVRPSGAISLVPTAARWVRESNDEQIANAHAMLEHAADTLLDTGLQVSTRAHSGIPADILNEEARTWDARSIFDGALGFARAHGHRHVGSVAAAVITHAPCPVEIVRG